MNLETIDFFGDKKKISQIKRVVKKFPEPNFKYDGTVLIYPENKIVLTIHPKENSKKNKIFPPEEADIKKNKKRFLHFIYGENNWEVTY